MASETVFFLAAPGVLAFCMVLSEFQCVRGNKINCIAHLDLYHSILQRAGVVPMSIAGIAKEVFTILISSWFFGDKLTLLNAAGVTITVCGMFCIFFLS